MFCNSMGDIEIPTLSLWNRIKIQTDHQPLVYLNETKFVNDGIMRWGMFIQNNKFKIEVTKGSENVGADFLAE